MAWCRVTVFQRGPRSFFLRRRSPRTAMPRSANEDGRACSSLRRCSRRRTGATLACFLLTAGQRWSKRSRVSDGAAVSLSEIEVAECRWQLQTPPALHQATRQPTVQCLSWVSGSFFSSPLRLAPDCFASGPLSARRWCLEGFLAFRGDRWTCLRQHYDKVVRGAAKRQRGS